MLGVAVLVAALDERLTLVATPPDVRSPNPVDRHVGERVRLRRKLLGISQEQLAAGLKVSFQQVQKYERGANRISASKLYDVATVLKVPVAYFFEGLDNRVVAAADPDREATSRAISAFLNTAEGLELAVAFTKIGRSRIRRQILALARTVADDDGPLKG